VVFQQREENGIRAMASGPRAQMKKFLLPTAFFASSLLLLVVSYPFSTHLQHSSFGAAETLTSYFILGIIVTAIGAYVSPIAVKLMLRRTASRSQSLGIVITGLVAFTMLAGLSYLFGPLGLNVPATRIRGIFFAEWNFLSFIVYDGTVLAFLSAMAYLYDARRAGGQLVGR
jgi:hypothetical protein